MSDHGERNGRARGDGAGEVVARAVAGLSADATLREPAGRSAPYRHQDGHRLDLAPRVGRGPDEDGRLQEIR